LLVDEIGDLDLPLQAKLLRALDRGEVRRVGGTKWVKVDVRVIAATRRDLDKAVAQGRFRDDLFHRLAVARIELPPLRERHGDVAMLAHHFALEMGASPEDVKAEMEKRFSDYRWPGNVRELRNAVASYVALGDEWRSPPPSQRGALAEGKATHWIEAIIAEKMPYPLARRRALAEFERRYIEHVLSEHGGSVTNAARASAREKLPGFAGASCPLRPSPLRSRAPRGRRSCATDNHPPAASSRSRLASTSPR
jgi:transcriptional regulator with GAF, ATPase, and Fis domain